MAEQNGDVGDVARPFGPERLGGQGLDPEQTDSGNRAIEVLLTSEACHDLVDLVVTWRDDDAGGAYEVWSRRGLVRFRRFVGRDGALRFDVIEVVGENPIANDDAGALRNVEQEREAARVGGFDGDDAARRFVAPEQQSYPFGYERVAQLFDSPNAPDLVVSPTDWGQGPYAGNHGALHVRQARAPLWIKGRRVRPGPHDLAVREVDVAPTLLAALGFPKRDGADSSGRTSSERGASPDVYLRRQDGRVLHEILDLDDAPPERVYVLLLDGLHMTEVDARLAQEPERYPHLARVRDGAAVARNGQIVNFPSITWPSHTTLCTGAWCGHHDVVNPSYYLRDQRETVSPQGQQVRTEGFANPAVESLYEAFHRVRGAGCTTAAIHAPFGRGATHAVLEGRNTGDRPTLKKLTSELMSDCASRWQEDGDQGTLDESKLDNRGMAQVIEIFSRPHAELPSFVYHELALTDGAGHHYGPHGDGLREALRESDRRVGRVLELLEDRGVLDETLLVVAADHGMAPQDPALHETPFRALAESGVECVVAEPMIWLRDLAVEVERAADGRTGRVIVCELDALASGERPTVEGANVVVSTGCDGEDAELARGRTGTGGVYGFPTPSDVDTREIRVSVDAAGFNRRTLWLDGRAALADLREALYGAAECRAGSPSRSAP